MTEENETMEKPIKESESNEQPVWKIELVEMEDLSKRRDTAFNVALGKLLDSNGNIETVMQTGEAFGRGLFHDCIKEKPHEWTMEEWLNSMVEHVFNPLGNTFTFSKITNNEVKSLLTKCPLQKFEDESKVASLFTYGFMRGLLKSAFPKGELLMDDKTDTNGSKMTEFIFKTTALYKDKFERKRVKSSFDITKKL